MTEKLYEVDSYVQNFTAQVVSCTPVPGGFAVVLDRTAFFPEGGGQPCDTGRLGGARVLAVHTDGETITHTTDAPLTAGETVDGCLDWPARLDAMQQHTGEHILSGALHRLFGAENVGFHIGSPYVRMDTSIPLTQEQLAQAEAEANAAVRADTPVHCWVPDPETLARTDYRSKKELTGDVRLVEAGGDCCACCGTHLTRTGEVGLIKIISFAHYKSGMRLAVACGQRAYDAVAGIWADTEAAGRLLSSPVGSLTPALERLQNGEAAFRLRGGCCARHPCRLMGGRCRRRRPAPRGDGNHRQNKRPLLHAGPGRAGPCLRPGRRPRRRCAGTLQGAERRLSGPRRRQARLLSGEFGGRQF